MYGSSLSRCTGSHKLRRDSGLTCVNSVTSDQVGSFCSRDPPSPRPLFITSGPLGARLKPQAPRLVVPVPQPQGKFVSVRLKTAKRNLSLVIRPRNTRSRLSYCLKTDEIVLQTRLYMHKWISIPAPNSPFEDLPLGVAQ